MAGPAKRKLSKTVRIRLNSFGLYDHLTGRYLKGKHGLYYLNGGLSTVSGFGGRGNMFKSAFSGTVGVSSSLKYNVEYTEFYDSELTMDVERIQDYINSVALHNSWEEIPQITDLLEDEKTTWNITASDVSFVDEWFMDNCRSEIGNREKVKQKDMYETPFYDVKGEPIYIPNPWIFNWDSVSESRISINDKKLDSNMVGDKDLNTEAMDDARHKSQLLRQVPAVASRGGMYFTAVAHADDELKMDKYDPSQKKLPTLKGNLKFKGVPGRAWTFLTNTIMLAVHNETLLNKQDKMCEYPHPEIPTMVGDPDLVKIRYIECRGKGGPTGAYIDLIFSQREGLDVTLTNYNYVAKELKSFGLEESGSGNAFKQLQIYPEYKFTRKDIRKHKENDPKFRRALELLAGLGYIYYNYHDVPAEMKIDIPELYTKVKDAGFDWDKILLDTVEYWQPAHLEKQSQKITLTARTLLGMAVGEFKTDHPVLKALAK